MSHVACHASPITGHMSLSLTATATDPPPSNSQQDAVAEFELDPTIYYFFRAMIFYQF